MITATAFEAEPLTAVLADASPLAVGSILGSVGRVGPARVSVVSLGIGKSQTAAGLARTIAALSPTTIVQLGIGGTYAGSFLPVGGVAVAAAEYDLDVGVATAEGWTGVDALGFELVPGAGATNRIPTDAALTHWLAGGRIPVAPFGTSDAVSGDLDTAAARHARFDLAVESMEGAAAAQTALAFGLPFAEVRGISNVAGQRDKSGWEIRAALRAAVAVLAGALRARA